MIVRLSKKLSTKIHEPDLPAILPDSHPYLDWHAHLFICNRAQYIMVTNSTSLFSVFMHGAGVTDSGKFLDRFNDTLKDVLHGIGADPIFQKIIVPGMKGVRFAKAQDKRIISSMNDNIGFAKEVLIDENPSPYDLTFRVNENIHSSTGYVRTTELFLSMKTGGEQK
jgi:hypothetical protein